MTGRVFPLPNLDLHLDLSRLKLTLGIIDKHTQAAIDKVNGGSIWSIKFMKCLFSKILKRCKRSGFISTTELNLGFLSQ